MEPSSGNGFAGKGGHRTVNTTDNSTVTGLGACIYERREGDKAVIPCGLGHRAEGAVRKARFPLTMTLQAFS